MYKATWLPINEKLLKPNVDYLIANTTNIQVAQYHPAGYWFNDALGMIDFDDYPCYSQLFFNLPTPQDVGDGDEF